ncbi:Mariner Mos1 transposase [Eumeta japonica]|uniref:Mariner Mos1 transposase n=1 Tax=Eumeta variegata TaxID=151549 RepID=A0A4C1UMN6_EUMVA|nr:Mariner Mos1 transposase [Eumeta japonica]
MDKFDSILQKPEQDQHISFYKIAIELEIDHKSVSTYLKKKLDIQEKLNTWVPHELTERNLMNRILICDSLLKRDEIELFFKRSIIGEEKWCMCRKSLRNSQFGAHLNLADTTSQVSKLSSRDRLVVPF